LRTRIAFGSNAGSASPAGTEVFGVAGDLDIRAASIVGVMKIREIAIEHLFVRTGAVDAQYVI
jgi:hypothetical protein